MSSQGPGDETEPHGAQVPRGLAAQAGESTQGEY